MSPGPRIALLTLGFALISAYDACAQLHLSTPANYSVGNSPLGVAAGDFNGDGVKDLAVVNTADQTVSILLGNGDGTFQAAVNYPCGATPAYVAVADFNGDGKLDLAISNGASQTVSILLGNGDGTFQAPVSYPSGANLDFMLVGDFNNDKVPDLVAYAQGSQGSQGSISVFLGKGDGTFQPAINTVLAGFSSTGCGYGAFVAEGDFNGDDNLDIVATSGCALQQFPDTVAGTILILAGNSDGTFQPAVTTQVPGFELGVLAPGDFDANGKLDMATIAYTHGCIQLYSCGSEWDAQNFLGDGAGAFGGVNFLAKLASLSSTFSGVLPFFFGSDVTASSISAADMNHDGRADITVMFSGQQWSGNPFACGTLASFEVFLSNGDGTFQPGQEVVLSSCPHPGTVPTSMAVADLTGNGLSDIILTNGKANSISIFFNQIPTSTSLALTAGSNLSPFGQSLTFTANVLPGAANGTVEFDDGATKLATMPLSQGAASYTTTALAVGVHSISASYSGTPAYAASSSPVLTQVVFTSGAAGTASVALNVLPVNADGQPETFFRQSATFSIQVVASSGSGTPTGNVVLLDADTQLGPVLTLDANGTATFSSLLSIAMHPVSAIYLGDANFNGAVSSTCNASISAVCIVQTSPRPKPR